MLRSIMVAVLALLVVGLLTPMSLDAAGGDQSSALPADGELRALDPNSETWHRFEYKGNNSPLQVNLTDSGSADIRFRVYTPEQIENWRRGLGLKAVGEITRAGGVPNRNLVWAGHFNNSGTYYITVRNLSSVVISYRLNVSGPGVYQPTFAVTPSSNVESVFALPAKSLPAPFDPPLPAIASYSVGRFSTLPPGIAQTLAAKNDGFVTVENSIRLIPGAVYANVGLRIVKSGVAIIGDRNNPPTIIPPAGKYAIVAHNVEAPGVADVNIQLTTLPQDQWKWYADITNRIAEDNKYGGVLFVNSRFGFVRNVVIVGADGTTDGASHSAGVVGVTLINNTGTLVANSKLNGNIFGIVIAGGNRNVLLDNEILHNIRQGLVPGTGDLCNGCDSAALAITYGPDGAPSHHNIIGLPGHGNRIGGGNAVFIICNRKVPGGGAGHNNFFIENNLWAEWNAVESVASEGNVFVRNVINFSKNTVGYWLTGSTFTVDSRYADGLLGEEGKVPVQVTDRRFGLNLSGVMKIVENPPLPSIGGLDRVSQYLDEQPPHSPYDLIP